MRVKVSYFYQIRFFKAWQIPLSTALSDPKWFHDFKGKHHKFIDKRGVINGLRAESFHPGETCNNLCHGKENCIDTPDKCRFLVEYRKQIFSLDREKVIKRLEALEDKIQKKFSIQHEIEFIFIVHESPQNICSERNVIKEFFRCEEYNKHDYYSE